MNAIRLSVFLMIAILAGAEVAYATLVGCPDCPTQAVYYQQTSLVDVSVEPLSYYDSAGTGTVKLELVNATQTEVIVLTGIDPEDLAEGIEYFDISVSGSFDLSDPALEATLLVDSTSKGYSEVELTVVDGEA